MDELRNEIERIMRGSATMPASAAELDIRTELLELLFSTHDEDVKRLGLYVQLTEEIPLWILEIAIMGLLRSHHWNNLPLPADVWSAARFAAGMHRERYHGGKYLPPERDWPPTGKRYAVTVGEFESLAPGLAIGPGELAPQLSDGRDSEPDEYAEGDDE